jgi:hypothetical protein
MRVLQKCHQRGYKTGREVEGKFKSSEVNTRAVSRGQNELLGEFR